MLAKFGRSHRGNCYRIYFEKSPSNSFLSLIPRLQPENPENSKGRSEKESLFKRFWAQVYITYITYFSSPIARYQKWQMSLHELQCKIEEVKPAYQCFFLLLLLIIVRRPELNMNRQRGDKSILLFQALFNC